LEVPPDPGLELTVQDLAFGFEQFLAGGAVVREAGALGGLPTLLEVLCDEWNKNM
jgi:hypothetical protein